MLYQNDAEYKDVIEIFGSNERGDTQNVTLNKFLNALKVFGVKVEKKNNKYSIKNIPFSTKFDIEDLKALAIFEKIAENLPDKNGQKVLTECIEHIKKHLSSQSSASYLQIKANTQTNYDFYYKELKDQIAECENYISQSFKISLKYKDKNDEYQECFCTPKEVIYDNKHAYLRIYKSKTGKLEDVPIQNILSAEQMPTQKDLSTNTTTVAFRLKGRLAKSYTLKNDEYISEYGKDGSILVINRSEPTDILLERLMRYDFDCKIEYPKELQRKMQELIIETLKNYE